MTIAEKTLVELVQELPADLHPQVRVFVEFLLYKNHRERERIEKKAPSPAPPTDDSPEARGWPPGYFETVIGSLPDFPSIDRHSDGIDPSLDETDEELRIDLPINSTR